MKVSLKVFFGVVLALFAGVLIGFYLASLVVYPVTTTAANASRTPGNFKIPTCKPAPEKANASSSIHDTKPPEKPDTSALKIENQLALYHSSRPPPSAGPGLSHFRCVDEFFDAHSRKCIFYNVCVTFDDKPFLTYYHLADEPIMRTWDQPKGQNSLFPDPFVCFGSLGMIGAYGNSTEERCLRVKVRKGRIPQDVAFIKRTSMLVSPFNPVHWAHALADDIFPVWQLQERFLRHTRQLQLVFAIEDTANCEKWRDACRANLNDLARLVTDVTPIHQAFFKEVQFKTFDGEIAGGYRPICFSELIVGHRTVAAWNPHVDEWDRFVEMGLPAFGIDPFARPKKQSIVFFKKVGRRATLNGADVSAYLEEFFQVPTTYTDPSEMSLQAQFELMQTTTVAIAGLGGLSFISGFMPIGSSAIYIGFWNATSERVTQMDRQVWTHNYRVRDFYYRLSKENETFPYNYFNFMAANEIYRTYFDIKLDARRMSAMVYHALVSVEREYGWKNSFSRDRVNELPEVD